ncbi:type II toxin-antitoxin system VapC family toxin [Candidatus Bathyarchaeota archaeon]|nr:type II toxin-antitoxin system VapC family toxin [Candidatus Bathyarchaeota archaeon]
MEKMVITQVVIDTDILIDLLRNVKITVNFLSEIERKGVLLSTTIINAFELFHGAYKSKKREENLLAIRKLIDRLIIVRMGLKSAETAGRIYADLEAKGQPIGLRDAILGAITLSKGYALATRNVEHLKKIPGLTLIPAP